MSGTQVQWRGGTTAECLAFIPAVKEIIVDTTLKCLRVGDGVTPGGIRVATRSELDAAAPVYAGAAGGTANALTLAPSPALTAYTTGQRIVFVASATNTLAATLAVNGLAAVPIRRREGTAVIAGQIVTGTTYEAVYDGSGFRLTTAATSADVPGLAAELAAKAGLAGATFTGPVSIPSLGGGPVGGLRNEVTNGDFRVHARGTASVTASGDFPVDRFVIGGNGSRTAQRVALADSDRAAIGREEAAWALQLNVSGLNAANGFEILHHRMESARRLAGRQVTVSGWARRTAGAGNLGLEFSRSYGTGGAPSAADNALGGLLATFALSGTWQKFSRTLTIPAISGKTFGSNGDDNLSLNLWLSAGSDFNGRSNSLGVQSLTVQFADLQVEIGPLATPFEQRPQALEEDLCQRFGVALGAGASGGTSNTTNATLGLRFPSRMRAVPTLTLLNANASLNSPNVNLFTTSGLTLGTSTLTQDGGLVDVGGFTGMTARVPVVLQTNNLFASAEL